MEEQNYEPASVCPSKDILSLIDRSIDWCREFDWYMGYGRLTG
jgi:hypothetical protein